MNPAATPIAATMSVTTAVPRSTVPIVAPRKFTGPQRTRSVSRGCRHHPAAPRGNQPLVAQLRDGVAWAHRAVHDDAAVRATQSELASRWRVDELKGIDAKAPRELRATSVWGFAELDHRRTDLHPTAWRQVFAADV